MSGATASIAPIRDPNPLLEAALSYAERGWPVFPCAPQGKVPLLAGSRGHLDATTNRDLICELWNRNPNANIGISTGPARLVVIDVDAKNGGLESLESLRAAHGPLETFEVLSGGGGLHFYFRAPLDLEIVSRSNAFGPSSPGIDVRASGGYIIAPPSIHPSGRRYELEASNDGRIAALPAWAVPLLSGRDRTPIRGVDNDEKIDRGGRHAELMRFAGRLRRLGTGERALYETVSAVNRTQCVPPVAEKDVAHIVESAMKYEATEKRVDSQRGNAALEIENAAVVAREPIEEIAYDIAQIAPAIDAPALVFGPPASLKSWLALGICDAIVRGVPFAGLETRRRPAALYLNLDAGAATFRNRIRAVSEAPGFNFVTMTAAQYSADVLRALLARYRGGFIVIDCLSSIYNPDTKRDPAFAMRGFVDDLRALYAEFDCGGLVIDHPHRPKERGELGDYHGSIQKEAVFRTMWSIAAEPAQDDSTTRRTRIVCRKLSEGAPFHPIEIDVEFGARVTMRRVETTADPAARMTLTQTKILEWASRQMTAFSRRTVVEKVRGQSAVLTREAFDALVAAGHIVDSGSKRTNGVLYRAVHSNSGSGSQTHLDPPDPLRSGAVSNSGSGPLSLIGDPLLQTHSQTHSQTSHGAGSP